AVDNRHAIDVVRSITENRIELRIKARIGVRIWNIDHLTRCSNGSGNAFAYWKNDLALDVLRHDGTKLALGALDHKNRSAIDTYLLADDLQNNPCEFVQIECGVEEFRSLQNPVKA